MKKGFATFLLIIAFIFVYGTCVLNTFNVNYLKTDSGFDSSYDSSDWSSSSDHDYSSNGGYHTSKDNDAQTAMIAIAMVAIIVIVIFLLNAKSTKDENKNIEQSETGKDVSEQVLNKYGIDKEKLEKMKKIVFDDYEKIQLAWSNNDIEPVRGILSDEIYNMYKTQILTMVAKNERNVMSNISLRDVKLTNIKEQEGKIIYTFKLLVSCKDYIINTKTNGVLRGNMNKINYYNYDLKFMEATEEIETLKTCPNCKMAKMLLDKAGISYDVIDAEENVSLTRKFNVSKAPTLIVPNGDNVDVYENASNIKGFIERAN